MATHTYRYADASVLDASRGLRLATAGGRSPHPHFFRGVVEHPSQAARALLVVAEVARTRYVDLTAASRLRDPIVTSNVEVLRFESFSSCNGVHVRFDLDEAGFDAEHVDWGSTNVDVGEPLRRSLAGVAAGDPLRLSIGTDAVEVDTLDQRVVEHRVPLPARWLRGLGSVQVATAGMEPVAELGAAAARATLRELPRVSTGNRPLHVELGPRGARLTARPGPQRPSIVGPQRLAALTRLLPHVRGLTVLAPPAAARRRAGGGADPHALRASAWVVHLDAARVTLVLSPELHRGFSGEGGSLEVLVRSPEALVERVAATLTGQARLTAGEVASGLGLRTDEAADALLALAATGRVGQDVHTGRGFHRDLPYDAQALRVDRPRLEGAAALADEGAVELLDGGARVRTGTAQTVRHGQDGDTCTCQWFARHRGERGPCRHVLAVLLARSRQGATP